MFFYGFDGIMFEDKKIIFKNIINHYTKYTLINVIKFHLAS